MENKVLRHIKHVSNIMYKVLLGHSHVHSFTYCLWLFSHYKGTMPKIFTSWFFTKKVCQPLPKMINILHWQMFHRLIAQL